MRMLKSTLGLSAHDFLQPLENLRDEPRTAGSTIHHADIQPVGLIRNVLHAPASINQILSIF